MPKEYSLYEAKAKLSELVRRVREGGESVTITVHGKPAVEIRPVERDNAEQSLDAMFEEMDARGESHLVGGELWSGKLRVGRKYVPGALKRFLDDR